MAAPSAPLLDLLRSAARKKGWNTATLARQAGIDRGRLKQVLAGREPLTVDELIQLSEAMSLTPDDLGILSPSPQPTPTPAVTPMSAAMVAPPDDPEPFPDPFGVHAEQILKVGFALGVDIYFTLDVAQLEQSGVPRAVLSQFPKAFPIRLEAMYHRHNAPEYFEDGFQVRLSFDAVYTCLFPWAAFQQITLFPMAPEPEPELEPEPEPTRRGGHLRLVE